MKSIINIIYRIFFPADDVFDVKEKYGIPNTINIQISQSKGHYVITSEQLPGLITEADNLNKLLEVYNDAVLTYFNVPKRESDIVFNTLSINGVGTLTLKQEKKYA